MVAVARRLMGFVGNGEWGMGNGKKPQEPKFWYLQGAPENPGRLVLPPYSPLPIPHSRSSLERPGIGLRRIILELRELAKERQLAHPGRSEERRVGKGCRPRYTTLQERKGRGSMDW